jgi:SpoVK/Ycf46/Vps4 family AAA+-type ATPase
MAVTNAPWDIDNAFLRPGRLHLRLYVGPPKGEALVRLLKIFLRNPPVSGAFKSDEVLMQISEKLEGFTGAHPRYRKELAKVSDAGR